MSLTVLLKHPLGKEFAKTIGRVLILLVSNEPKY